MEIKGIKMNGELLKEFGNVGRGYKYVCRAESSAGKTIAYINIDSKEDLQLQEKINVEDVIDKFGILEYESLRAVSESATSGDGVQRAYFTRTAAVFITNTNWFTRILHLIVIGKRENF